MSDPCRLKDIPYARTWQSENAWGKLVDGRRLYVTVTLLSWDSTQICVYSCRGIGDGTEATRRLLGVAPVSREPKTDSRHAEYSAVVQFWISVLLRNLTHYFDFFGI